MDIKAIALRPLDGNPIGAEVTLPKEIFDQLKARGVVKAAPVPKAPSGAKQEKAPANKKAADPANK